MDLKKKNQVSVQEGGNEEGFSNYFLCINRAHIGHRWRYALPSPAKLKAGSNPAFHSALAGGGRYSTKT